MKILSTFLGPAHLLTDHETRIKFDHINLAYSSQQINGLINNSLEKYHADIIGKFDFALASAGGRIVPELTTASYQGNCPGWTKWFLDRSDCTPKPATLAISVIVLDFDISIYLKKLTDNLVSFIFLFFSLLCSCIDVHLFNSQMYI